MSRSFIDESDAKFLASSLNFSTIITASAVLLGLTAAQAAAYAAKHAAYAAAYTAAVEPGTRTKGKVAAKNAAKKAAKTEARNLAAIIRSTPTVTDEQLIDLGLGVRSAPAPQPPPDAPPSIDIVSVIGRVVKVRLHDSVEPSRRGKPPGVHGATVLSYVGETAPADPADWKFEGNTNERVFAVEFPLSVAPGAKVWLTAFWFNNRSQSGPAAAPISTHTQFGGLSQAA